MKQKLKEAQLAEKRERREQKQQQREDKAMSRKQEKENRQMLKEQQKKDAQKQKEQARENFRQIREQEAEERNLRNQLVQNVEKEERPVRPPKKELSRKEEKSEKVQEVPDLLPMSWTASYIPLKQVKNGIIQTSDNRFVKIVEVLPINFLLRSSSEQRSIILSFMSYLKIAPPNIQLKVLSRKADIQEYIDKIDEEAEKETDERCKILQEDYAELIKSLGMKEAITRRFFLIFEYPSRSGSKNPDERDVHLYMRSAVQTAKKYLAMCGNIVLEHENETRFCVEILFQLLNRQTCLTESLDDRIKEVRKYYTEENGPESIRYIPVTELVAPRTIDFRNWNYVVVDGLYYTYLYVQKYRSRVPAGWLSLLINAGEGIDVDVFFFKQDKNRCVERIGRRIRLNRSKIKDTYDSNSDFDSLSESIQAGYYLKRGLSGSEEFYYMSILVTITGHSEQEVEWRSKEMTKLLSSQDIGTGSCIFREEQAFLSSLPFLQIDKNIYEKSKRNVLTSGVAACYPFASYEMSDKDGIMIGVNKATGSPIVDRMCRLQFTGNVIPAAWYRTITRDNGKPNLTAIIILSDVVYWYRPVEIRDELTGQLCGFRKKFKADILQRNYQQLADQFGISKREAVNAVVELEKIGVVRRVFRTVRKGGMRNSNVLFLELNVDVLIQLTYPENLSDAGYHFLKGELSPHKERGATSGCDRISQSNEAYLSFEGDTNTEITEENTDIEYPLCSYQAVERAIRIQISYDALKNDHPYDRRVEEILGLILDVMVSTAPKLRINREEKDIEIVKAQFAKLTKDHVEFVLQSMDDTSTKARNIRAVLLTALYNSVNTINSYYGNRYHFHLAEETRREMEETD